MSTGLAKAIQPGKPVPGEQKREKVTRCKVCLGTPDMREPGRLDDYGKDICLPGMARCRLCWEAYAPLPAPANQVVLMSSAGTTLGARAW